SDARCPSRTSAYAGPKRVNSLVDPSMSENNNVTVPDGKPAIPPSSTQPGPKTRAGDCAAGNPAPLAGIGAGDLTDDPGAFVSHHGWRLESSCPRQPGEARWIRGGARHGHERGLGSEAHRPNEEVALAGGNRGGSRRWGRGRRRGHADR